MASDVRVRFRSFLPGAGFDSAGNAKQGKTRVVGRINVTSYVSGEPLVASDIGLSNIDHITMRVEDETGDQNASTYRQVLYVKTLGEFYINKIDRTGVTDQHAPAATEVIEFDPFGGSAADVELL